MELMFPVLSDISFIPLLKLLPVAEYVFAFVRTVCDVSELFSVSISSAIFFASARYDLNVLLLTL
jgi:hypothetical protein